MPVMGVVEDNVSIDTSVAFWVACTGAQLHILAFDGALRVLDEDDVKPGAQLSMLILMSGAACPEMTSADLNWLLGSILTISSLPYFAKALNLTQVNQNVWSMKACLFSKP